MRCVPDVSITAVQYYAYFVSSGDGGFAGTSASCPVFAAYIALINQARANNGLGSLGVLGPNIYPLIGTSAFNDITVNETYVGPGPDGKTQITVVGNGAYQAGVGYDMCTGIGTPNFNNLLSALTTGGTPVGVSTNDPATVSLASGNPVELSVTGTTNVTFYQWQVNTGSGWNNLSDGLDSNLGGATAAGSATANLTISGTLTANSGDQFQCVVSSGPGGTTATSNGTTITVLAPVSTFEGVSVTTGLPGSTIAVGQTFTVSVTNAPGVNYQ